MDFVAPASPDRQNILFVRAMSRLRMCSSGATFLRPLKIKVIRVALAQIVYNFFLQF